MKENRKYVKEWLNTFVYVFGLLQILFTIKQFLPHFGGTGGITWYDIFASSISALVFSVSHFVINSDWLDNRISVKKRVIYCGIPCALTGLLLSYNLGLQHFMPHVANKAVASAVWVLSYLVSIGVYVGIFFAIERRYKKQSKSYNEALEKFKKEL